MTTFTDSEPKEVHRIRACEKSPGPAAEKITDEIDVIVSVDLDLIPRINAPRRRGFLHLNALTLPLIIGPLNN